MKETHNGICGGEPKLGGKKPIATKGRLKDYLAALAGGMINGVDDNPGHAAKAVIPEYLIPEFNKRELLSDNPIINDIMNFERKKNILLSAMKNDPVYSDLFDCLGSYYSDMRINNVSNINAKMKKFDMGDFVSVCKNRVPTSFGRLQQSILDGKFDLVYDVQGGIIKHFNEDSDKDWSKPSDYPDEALNQMKGWTDKNVDDFDKLLEGRRSKKWIAKNRIHMRLSQIVNGTDPDDFVKFRIRLQDLY